MRRSCHSRRKQRRSGAIQSSRFVGEYREKGNGTTFCSDEEEDDGTGLTKSSWRKCGPVCWFSRKQGVDEGIKLSCGANVACRAGLVSTALVGVDNLQGKRQVEMEVAKAS